MVGTTVSDPSFTTMGLLPQATLQLGSPLFAAVTVYEFAANPVNTPLSVCVIGGPAGAFAVRQLVQFGNEALQVADSIGKTAGAVGVKV